MGTHARTDSHRRATHRRAVPPAAVAALAGVALLAGSACSAAPPSASGPDTLQLVAGSSVVATTPAPVARVPGAAWTLADPATQRPELAEITAAVDGSDTDCVVVVKHGEIIHESTYNGIGGEQDQVVFSVSKSIISALVGIAQDQGKLRIDQPASDFVTEWKGTPSEAVTIRQLLSMDSGRFVTLESGYLKMPFQADQSGYATGLSQQHPPGEHWEYNNAGVQDLEVVLRRATGTEVVAYADTMLFTPIGAKVTWAMDPAGHPWAYGGATASCRDLARFGVLYARGGRWGDRQVVPEAWVRQSVESSQTLNPGYGFLWWLNKPSTEDGSGTGTGKAGDLPMPQLGPDAFSARGAKGQYIAISPSEDLVVVRTGRDKVGDRFKDTEDVLSVVLDKVKASGATG